MTARVNNSRDPVRSTCFNLGDSPGQSDSAYCPQVAHGKVHSDTKHEKNDAYFC